MINLRIGGLVGCVCLVPVINTDTSFSGDVFPGDLDRVPNAVAGLPFVVSVFVAKLECRRAERAFDAAVLPYAHTLARQ